MTCPDTERLLEAVLGETADPAVQHQLRACPHCGSTSCLVKEMRAAYRPKLDISEALVERRVELIAQQQASRHYTLYDARLRDMAISSVLALATVIFTIATTGSFGSGPWVPASLGAIAMIVAAGYERRQAL